ncbi:MAG: cell division protein SepF [Oscillibacter sp.]|jgi:cell division inhibitor SepF|nr:cell division protein SepF [Oscillibacter sp.]
MSFLDELKKWTHPYEDEDEEYEDEDLLETPKKESPFESRRAKEDDRRSKEDDRRSKEDDRRNKIVNIHATTQLKVVLVKPERFENASEIADHLKDKRTVVVNLESTNKDIARRLIDFLSGVAYAGEGKIKKVAANTYIITPYHVDIEGDLIDELENNGLYF